MNNCFLSGRISPEFYKQVEEYLIRTGESKTEMLVKAVAAYIGTELPPLKVAGGRRLEYLEREVAGLKGAIENLDKKLATLSPKIESQNIQTVINVIDTPRAEAAGILKTIISVLKALTKCLY